MGYLNGVVVKEAIELKTTIDSDNPIIGPNEMQLSYDSVDGSGVYHGVRARVGPGHWLDLEDIFNNQGSNKQPVTIPGTSMPADNVYTYTLTSGDISKLGTTISIVGFMVNNQDYPVSYSFSANQGSLSAGDTIAFTGLPAKADVTTINFTLI